MPAASTDSPSLAARIASTAQAHPGRAAVVPEAGPAVSYGDLERRSDELAHRLAAAGAAPGTLIGHCTGRGPDMIVGLLAILKTGAAYLPLDPAYPADRLAFMLEDSGVALVCGEAPLLARLPLRVPAIEVQHASPPHAATPFPVQATLESLAYVIYTSGSTGRPKGVEIPHRAVDNLLSSLSREPGLSGDDRVLAITTLSFDIAVVEIWLPLAVGATVVLATRETAADGRALRDLIRDRGVSVIQATPATWRLLLDAGWREGAGVTALIGGEALPRSMADAILDTGAELWNMYGPTETTVWSSTWRVAPSGPVLIGTPIDRTEFLVLDAARRRVDVGEVGELHIGGAGLARGYRNRPELTAEKFIAHPFSTERDARLYRTGDLARQHTGGRFECLGRVDFQVKVNGYRIEPGEIQAALECQAGVGQAVVRALERAPGDMQLVAYVVHGDAPAPRAADLRRALQASLPPHMVPSRFVMLRHAPLTPAGKVDREALPPPDWGRDTGAACTPPRTDVERRLATLWREVLELDDIGVDDDFFELGGRSRTGAHVFARIEMEFGTRLPLAALFEAPTIATLAARLEQGDRSNDWSSLVPIRPSGSVAPFFCVHPAGGNVVTYRPLAERLDPDVPFFALQSVGLDGRRTPLRSVEAMAAAYIREMRSVQPHGPYHLGGASFGGLVAFEMAVQLERAGEPVALVAILDTDFPEYPVGRVFSALAEFPFVRHRIHPVLFRLQRHARALLRRGPRGYLALVRGADPTEGRDDEAPAAGQRQRSDPFAHILARVEAANLRANDLYVPRRYGATLTYFKAIGNTPVPDRRGLWRHVAGDVRVHEVPGEHFTIRREPHVRVLAARLGACLRAVQTATRAA